MKLLGEFSYEGFVGRTKLQMAGRSCWCCRKMQSDELYLSRCSICQRAVYCGAGCQKVDWTQHKPLCKRFERANDLDAVFGKDPTIFKEYTARQNIRCALFIDNPTSCVGGRFSGQYLYDQIKCDVCYRTPFATDERLQLTSCSRCHLSFHCTATCHSQFPAAHPVWWCDTLRLTAAVEKLRLACCEKLGPHAGFMVHTERPKGVYTPLSDILDWNDYKRHVWDGPISLDDVMPELLKRAAIDDPTVMDTLAMGKLIMDVHSMPLTIIAGLDAVMPNLRAKARLVVHIVGASEREDNNANMMEQILHLLPALQSIVAIFVSPTVRRIHSPRSSPDYNHACKFCPGRDRRQISYADTYHRFMETDLYASNMPDIIVGFNTGHSNVDVEDWQLTLSAILDANIPAVFTTLDGAEAHTEELALKKMGARFILPPMKNKWCGVVPRIWLDKPRSIDYNNYFWYIVGGRQHA